MEPVDSGIYKETEGEEMSLQDYINQMPDNYYIDGKCLWCGNKRVCINHVDNDLNKPLDYESAFKMMMEKLEADK